MKKENCAANAPYISPCHCSMLRQASRALTGYYDRALEPSGLRVTQYSLLNRLRRHGPVSMNELSGLMQLDRTTLIRNLNPLVKRELVEISAAVRAHQVAVTEKGLAEMAKALPLWDGAQNEVEKLFTAAELESLREYLARLCVLHS